MFLLDGRPLSPDVPFKHDGISYPANWLRLASLEEREAIGITEQPDAEPFDERFCWGPDLPKDHTQLVEQWVGQVKSFAGSILSSTDWYIIRSAEPGAAPAPAAVLEHRAAVRAASNAKEAEIEGTADTAALAAYVTSQEFSSWPMMGVQEPTAQD